MFSINLWLVCSACCLKIFIGDGMFSRVKFYLVQDACDLKNGAVSRSGMVQWRFLSESEYFNAWHNIKDLYNLLDVLLDLLQYKDDGYKGGGKGASQRDKNAIWVVNYLLWVAHSCWIDQVRP